MPRYIDADSALAFPLANRKYDRKNANKHFIYGCETYKEWLEQLPTVSPDEVRGVGKWIDKPTGRYGQRQSWCSACGNHSGIGGIESARHKPYCPNCGAKMEVNE